MKALMRTLYSAHSLPMGQRYVPPLPLCNIDSSDQAASSVLILRFPQDQVSWSACRQALPGLLPLPLLSRGLLYHRYLPPSLSRTGISSLPLRISSRVLFRDLPLRIQLLSAARQGRKLLPLCIRSCRICRVLLSHLSVYARHCCLRHFPLDIFPRR